MHSRSTSSSYSLVSQSLVDINSTFRISISLQRYFKDVRSRCYMLGNRNRSVRWLEKRIQNIFGIPGKFCLSTNGHMLPSCEALALLNSDDTVDVVPFLTDLGADVIMNGNSTDHDTYRCDEKTRSSDIGSISKQCNRNKLIDKLKQRSSVVDGTASEIDQNISQIINEDQINARSYTMEPSDCLTLVDSSDHNDHLSLENMNIYNDNALLNMKRKALALLDNKTSADKDEKKSEDIIRDPPKRSRHRVRRRRRRATEVSPDRTQQDPEVNISAIGSPKVQIENNHVPDVLQASQTVQIAMQPAASAIVSPATETESNVISSTPIPEVTCNETICPRRPRVVYSLDN